MSLLMQRANNDDDDNDFCHCYTVKRCQNSERYMINTVDKLRALYTTLKHRTSGKHFANAIIFHCAIVCRTLCRCSCYCCRCCQCCKAIMNVRAKRKRLKCECPCICRIQVGDRDAKITVQKIYIL